MIYVPTYKTIIDFIKGTMILLTHSFVLTWVMTSTFHLVVSLDEKTLCTPNFDSQSKKQKGTSFVI